MNSLPVNLPKSWDDVCLDQWISLKNIDKDLSLYGKWKEILCILTDTLSDDELWDDLDVLELTNMIDGLKWLSIEPISNPTYKVLDLNVIDINKLTLGEFIDLEWYFKEYNENLNIIASILYRKTIINEWGNVIYEPHGSYNIQDRANTFNEYSINNFYWLIKYYLDFKTSIINTYSDLFDPPIEDLEDEELTPDEIEEELRDKSRVRWAWELVLHRLSSGDITKYDSITSLPLIFVLNQLSFRKEMKIEY